MNQFGGSRTDTLIKFILVFFISLLSFSVGTFVGKQFSDSQHRLAQLETDYEKSETEMRGTASIPEDQMEVAPEKALTEEDVSKLSEDFVAEEKAEAHGEGHEVARDVASKGKDDGTEVIDAHASHGADKPMKDKVSEAAGKVAKGEAPLAPQAPAKKVEAPKLPNTVAASTIGKFTVQISAQPSEDMAKEQSLKLKDQGYSAFYVEGAKEGKKWYRVNVGLFQNRGEAQDYAKQLAQKPEFKGAFVKEIVQ